MLFSKKKSKPGRAWSDRAWSDYEIALMDLQTTNIDSKPTRNENYAEQLISVHDQFVQRNRKLTNLLDDYITQRSKRVKENRVLKFIIFGFFLALLAVLTAAVIVFVYSRRDSEENLASAISLVSVSVTYLGSLIGVFEIMSKYLFPTDEEKDTISMIQAVINNDVQVEKTMSDAIGKSFSDDVERLRIYKQLREDDAISDEELAELKAAVIEKLKKQ